MPIKRFVWMLLAACLGACQASQAADLSALEQRWLRGITPVLAFAAAAGFPLDIIVQPQDTPGLTPIGTAFVDGRCKLVLSMRGNAKAQATLDRIEPALRDATLELMAAHELGHCQRYREGRFVQAPAGFAAPAEGDAQAIHREEGYADLVGLAWTQQRHPALYARLHGWLVAERSAPGIAGSEHDTGAWLQLVGDGARLADPAMFDNAAALWAEVP